MKYRLLERGTTRWMGGHPVQKPPARISCSTCCPRCEQLPLRGIGRADSVSHQTAGLDLCFDWFRPSIGIGVPSLHQAESRIWGATARLLADYRRAVGPPQFWSDAPVDNAADDRPFKNCVETESPSAVTPRILIIPACITYIINFRVWYCFAINDVKILHLYSIYRVQGAIVHATCYSCTLPRLVYGHRPYINLVSRGYLKCLFRSICMQGWRKLCPLMKL